MKSKNEFEIGKPQEVKISEDFLQKQVARYMDLKHPGVWCHIPNGGSRHLLEAVKLKAMGVKPGFPDIMIFKQVHSPEFPYPFPGFFVELKVGKNKCSPEQLKVQQMLRDNGWQGIVAWNFHDAVTAIEAYFEGKFVS